MILHLAICFGDAKAVRALLAAGADVEAADTIGWLPIHSAAFWGHAQIVQMLLEAAPSTATAVTRHGMNSLHWAAYKGHTAVVQLLTEAAPATVSAVTNHGGTSLDFAFWKGTPSLPAARCLVRAAPTVQPTLCSLVKKSERFKYRLMQQGPLNDGLDLAATLYADLVSLLALAQQEWQSIPAPCPDLARVLPAVMERSVAEAGWLVGRLGQMQRAQLRTAALSLNRAVAAIEGRSWLPAELSRRILALALAQPPTREEEATFAKEQQAIAKKQQVDLMLRQQAIAKKQQLAFAKDQEQQAAALVRRIKRGLVFLCFIALCIFLVLLLW